VTHDDRRHPAGRLFVVTMLSLLAGCPYDADVEPAGHPLPLRPSVVGVWVCDLNDDASWADLTVGWTQGSMYLLTVRVRRPDKDQTPGPWALRARPLRLGRDEVWSVAAEDPDAETPDGKFIFLRLERARQESLRLGVLGGSAGDMKGHLDETSPAVLARFLQDRQETKAECRLACHR
jgi:hypothetical protein